MQNISNYLEWKISQTNQGTKEKVWRICFKNSNNDPFSHYSVPLAFSEDTLLYNELLNVYTGNNKIQFKKRLLDGILFISTTDRKGMRNIFISIVVLGFWKIFDVLEVSTHNRHYSITEEGVAILRVYI